MMPSPLVSVIVMTYQHADFIEKCIQGIVAQHINFEIELLLGEDESNDGTREICVRLADDHPDLIKLILRSRKDVITILGRPTGRANLLDLLGRARGKYIALCEGDDHWIDPHKLQRQIDALEADPNAIGCFTDAYNETDGERIAYMDHGYATSPKGVVDQHRIIQGQGIPTCTFVFRNIDLEPYYKALQAAPVGDTLLFTYLSGHGHFIYQPERTGVRVIHPGGMYSMRSAVHKLDIHLRTLPYMDRLSRHKYTHLIHTRRNKLLNAAWSEALEKKNQELARYVWPMIARDRKAFGWNFTTTLRNWSKAYMPWLDKLFARITGS